MAIDPSDGYDPSQVAKLAAEDAIKEMVEVAQDRYGLRDDLLHIASEAMREAIVAHETEGGDVKTLDGALEAIREAQKRYS